MSIRSFALSCLIFLPVLAACQSGHLQEEKEKIDPETLPLVWARGDYNDLAGWRSDPLDMAVAALQKSCARILRITDPARTFGPDPAFGTVADWAPLCRDLNDNPPAPGAEQHWFEARFDVWRVSGGPDNMDGLFTGYYEPMLRGSRVKGGVYQTPLRKRPDDLVMVELGEFRESLKGQRIAGRVVNGALKPYEDRAKITTGALAGDEDLAIVYVDDPADAFFLHIQGSGRVQMEDGSIMRVGYAAQNGHVYYAVGRDLVARGALKKEDVSLQTIRAWMEQNPDQAVELMNKNPSYIFMQTLEGDGPLGGENIALTPERSLAVDRSKIAYGVPVWLDIAEIPGGESWRRLMIAQDTGGAIRGPVRGDVFFGAGDRAEWMAGHMKARGKWWFLLPKTVAPQ
jgi:membrane-bound lytic murein transglycosylase A